MYVAWYYKDFDRDVYYYVGSYEMSVSEFAIRLSEITGKNISAGDTSAASNWSEIEKRNAIHI